MSEPIDPLAEKLSSESQFTCSAIQDMLAGVVVVLKRNCYEVTASNIKKLALLQISFATRFGHWMDLDLVFRNAFADVRDRFMADELAKSAGPRPSGILSNRGEFGEDGIYRHNFEKSAPTITPPKGRAPVFQQSKKRWRVW